MSASRIAGFVAGLAVMSFLAGSAMAAAQQRERRRRRPEHRDPRQLRRGAGQGAKDARRPLAVGGLRQTFAAQVRARIDETAGEYRVASLLSGRPIVSGRFDPRGKPGPVSDFPNFAAVAPAFCQPFLGKLFFGPILCSIMTFELEKAILRPIEARIDVEDAYLPGMPAKDFRVPGIDASPLGAFHIEVPWTLSYPMACSCLPAAGSERT